MRSDASTVGYLGPAVSGEEDPSHLKLDAIGQRELREGNQPMYCDTVLAFSLCASLIIEPDPEL